MRTSPVVAAAILICSVPIAATAADNAATGIGVYRSFFAQRAQRPNDNPPPTSRQPAPAQKPAVVCGMTLLPTRPVDPKMKISAPDAKRFPTLTFEPQICKR